MAGSPEYLLNRPDYIIAPERFPQQLKRRNKPLCFKRLAVEKRVDAQLKPRAWKRPSLIP
jgi:hypothetical protein